MSRRSADLVLECELAGSTDGPNVKERAPGIIQCGQQQLRSGPLVFARASTQAKARVQHVQGDEVSQQGSTHV